MGLSTRELMRLVVLAALNLALFQGVWSILLIPPVTIAVLLCDLGLYCLLVRPRTRGRAVVIMVGVGLAAIVGMLYFMASNGFPPRPRLALWLLETIPEPLYRAVPGDMKREPLFLEYLVLDVLTITAMLTGGWLAWRFSALRRIRDTRSPVSGWSLANSGAGGSAEASAPLAPP